MDKKTARNLAALYLGHGYQRRLLAAFSVLVDGEGLFARFGVDSHAYTEVCNAFRKLREKGEIDF